MSEPIQIFLAHASEDKPQVRKLYDRLKAKGYKPWLDERDLMPGVNWPTEIENAINTSSILIACISQESVSKSGHVQREFRLALNKYAEMPPGTIFLIPLRLDDSEVPALRLTDLGVNLRDIQWVDYWKKDGFDSLVKAIDHSCGLKKNSD